MRILLSGYYGFGNLGDEALLEVIVARLRARFGPIEIDVLSATPEETARRYGVDATPRMEMRPVGEAIARADVVLSGGGGLLQSATSLRSLAYYVGVIHRAVRAGRKVMIFAQSIGPLDRVGRLMVRAGCRNIACATVRDARSLASLTSLLPEVPVERTADPVFLYDAPEDVVDLAAEGFGDPQLPYAVVCVRKAPGFDEGAKTVVRAVDRLTREHGLQVAFLALGGAPDAEVATKIIRRCETAPVLIPEATLAKTAAIIRGAHVAIAMRLHALILAARYAVPFVSIPYDPKVAALTDDLAYPLDALWTPGERARGPMQSDALIDRLLAERDVLAAHLRERIVEIRASAERNFEVLGELMRES